MKILPRASQKTDAMTFSADKTVFTLFGADSPLLVYCFDLYIIHGYESTKKIEFNAVKHRQRLD